MITVRILKNIVVEIIPEYALPVEKWYGETFAKQCIEAPDEVKPRWVYNPETNTFSEPVEIPEIDPEETPDAVTETDVWDEMAEAIKEGVNGI